MYFVIGVLHDTDKLNFFLQRNEAKQSIYKSSVVCNKKMCVLYGVYLLDWHTFYSLINCEIM